MGSWSAFRAAGWSVPRLDHRRADLLYCLFRAGLEKADGNGVNDPILFAQVQDGFRLTAGDFSVI